MPSQHVGLETNGSDWPKYQRKLGFKRMRKILVRLNLCKRPQLGRRVKLQRISASSTNSWSWLLFSCSTMTLQRPKQLERGAAAILGVKEDTEKECLTNFWRSISVVKALNKLIVEFIIFFLEIWLNFLNSCLKRLLERILMKLGERE